MHHIVQAGGLDQTLHGSDFAGYGGGGGSDLLFAVCQSLVSDWYVVDWSHCSLDWDTMIRCGEEGSTCRTLLHSICNGGPGEETEYGYDVQELSRSRRCSERELGWWLGPFWRVK